MIGPLTGKVALVAGATRGAGRGIAVALGEAGATVYCTGRSSRTAPRPARPDDASPFELRGRPETIEETAELVEAAGGTGIAVRIDHTDDIQVEALMARIERDGGRLDVLVNDVWGGDALTEWGVPFWELDLAKGRTMLERGLLSHLITARHAAGLMVSAGSGLVVEITDGERLDYRGTLFYDMVKTSVIRAAFAMAEELRPHGVAALALTPGFLRSEAMLEHFGVDEATWRDAVAIDLNFVHSETPRFVGRAVAALAADPDVMERSGRVWSSWTLARAYGFSDVDGARPDRGTHAVTRAVIAAARAAHRGGVTGFLGLHLEGPHLDPQRAGAHDPALIRPMQAEDLALYIEAARDLPALMLTLAPEAATPEQIAALTGAGVIVALGHSGCDAEAALAAQKAGARVVTHLFNAMSPFAHRAPGLTGVALDQDALACGLIADGWHAAPETLRLALRAKPQDALFLVSDAMALAGSAAEGFTLGGRPIRRAPGAGGRPGRLTLADGTLAGADLTLPQAVAHLLAVGAEPARAIAMASRVPAQVIGAQAGRLIPGERADFLHLGQDWGLRGVWRAGAEV